LIVRLRGWQKVQQLTYPSGIAYYSLVYPSKELTIDVTGSEIDQFSDIAALLLDLNAHDRHQAVADVNCAEGDITYCERKVQRREHSECGEQDRNHFR
jgi:hypothetical protein